MLDKETLAKLQEAQTLALLQEAKPDDLQVPSMVLPDGFRLESLEKREAFAARYRFNFETTSLMDFVLYSLKFACEGTTCFIDAESMEAKTILDLGTDIEPLHQEHTAKLSLRKTPEYQALLNINSLKMVQSSAAEFIEDWACNLICKTSLEDVEFDEVGPIQAAARIRSMTIENMRSIESKVDDYEDTTSVINKTEVKEKNTMPRRLLFTCAPYEGLPEHTFTIRLSMIADDRPMVGFRVVKMEKHQQEMAEEFQSEIDNKINEKTIELVDGGKAVSDIDIFIGK